MPATKKATRSAKAKSAESESSKTTEVETVVSEALESAAASAKEVVDITVSASNEATAKGYEQVVTAASEQVDAVQEAGADAFKSVKEYSDVFAFHKRTFDAVVEASGVWVSGVQDLNKTWGDFANKSVEQNTVSAKRLINCKSVEDVLALNSEVVRYSYDTVLHEAKNITELSARLVESTAKPLTARVNEAVTQFNTRLGA